MIPPSIPIVRPHIIPLLLVPLALTLLSACPPTPAGNRVRTPPSSPAAARPRLAVADGTALEEHPCSPAQPYDAWLAAFTARRASEMRLSGLADEFAQRPLSEFYPRGDYEALARAGESRQCVQLLYASDGLRIAGYVFHPAPRQPAQRFPVVLFARGGSRDLGRLDDAALMLFQSLAREGFIVLGSQYRGSTGSEGSDEFGGDDVHDLLNLVPIAQRLPDYDGRNLFVYGGSRGGMMAFLALRRGLDANAIAVRGGLSDLPASLVERPVLRSGWAEMIPDFTAREAEQLRERSVVSWPEAIHAPVLLIHGRQDWRASLAQSQHVDQLLAQHAVPHELVIVERADHQLTLHRTAEVAHVVRWFRRYMR